MQFSRQSENEYHDKLERFRRLKERLAKITNKTEQSQFEFNSYINSLKSICKYETGIRGVINICNNMLFECKYRSSESYGTKEKKECKREEMMKISMILNSA